MTRTLTAAPVFAAILSLAGIAAAQHPGHHHVGPVAGHHNFGQGVVFGVNTYPYGYGYGGYGNYGGYGGGYGGGGWGGPFGGSNFVSYEESVYRGAAAYAQGQAQANLINAQASKQWLDNDLRAAQNRAAKTAAIAEAKTIAAKNREERIAMNKVEGERKRLEALVNVDIGNRLVWPEALQDASLADLRSRVHNALGGDSRLTGLSSVDVDAVKSAADEMFQNIKARRDELGDFRVVAAKRYLDGLVRAANAAVSGGDKLEVSTKIGA
jgi:hypothetical protein